MCGGVTAAIHRPEAGTALSLKGSGGGVWVHVWDLAGIWIMWVKRGEMITNLRHVYAWIQPQPHQWNYPSTTYLENFSLTLTHTLQANEMHSGCGEKLDIQLWFHKGTAVPFFHIISEVFLSASFQYTNDTNNRVWGNLHWKLTYGKECQRNRKLEVSFQGLWHYYLFPVKQWISEWNKSSFIAQPYKTPSGWLSQTLKGINMRK